MSPRILSGGWNRSWQENIVNTRVKTSTVDVYFFWISTYLSSLHRWELRIYSTLSRNPLYLKTPPLLGTLRAFRQDLPCGNDEANVSGSRTSMKYTNHSLRAYGVTRLFQSNVPDKLIMERSELRSTEGLREYQQTDVLQELQVCKALYSAPTGKSLCNQVATV